MKKKWLTILLSFFMLSTLLSAQPRDIRVEFAEFGGPIMPTLSRILVSIPGSFIGEGLLLERIEVDFWYLAYSPILWPNLFLEIGAQLEFRPILRERSSLALKIGTAYEYFGGSFGIPLIAGIDWEQGFAAPISTGLQLDLLFWPGAGALEAAIPLRYHFDSGLILSLLPGVAAYTDLIQFVVNPRIALAIGFRFGVGS